MAARFEASAKTGKVRRFKEFVDGAASWSRVERIIARVEAAAQSADTRFIVTNLASGKAKALYEDVYCRRGAAQNLIKSWKTHLAADRTSCTRAKANQFRLFLHAGAYWLKWGCAPRSASAPLALPLRLLTSNWRPNPMMTTPETERCLRQLRLSGVRDTLQTRVLQAQGANQLFLETGKSHIAKAIAYQAILHSHRSSISRPMTSSTATL